MKKLYIASLLFIFFCSYSFGDIIYMKNGKKIIGQIVSETPDQLGIKTEKNFYYIKKVDIKKIQYNNAEENLPVDWGVITAGLIGASLFLLLFIMVK